MDNITNNDFMPVDGNIVVDKSEAGKILKEHGNRVSNNNVDAFVSLKDINKIYPNGVQAVYDFNIDINEKDFIVLVGPSGCGKSTTLRMVAGLEDITSGYLYIDKVLSNYAPSKDRDISMVFQSYALYPQMTVYDNIAFPLRARKYRRAMVSKVLMAWDQVYNQLDNPIELSNAITEAISRGYGFLSKVQYLATKLDICDEAAKILCKYNITNPVMLTPQFVEMIKAAGEEAKSAELSKLEAKGYTVGDNYQILLNGVVQYHNVKMSNEEIRRKVFEAAEILDLGPYLDRRPKELSGGQMQRVALGRAIVRNAKLFLMDEPLSNLDAKLRVQMRSEIVRIHEAIGATTIYVTHDQTEAMTMATKIAVMSKGWVQQIGTPQEIYYNPKNIFVATFIGSPAMNIFDGEYENGVITFRSGYQVDLGETFKNQHDQYYQNKIAELEGILQKPDFIKMKTLKLIDAVLANIDSNSADIKSVLEEILHELKNINDGTCENAVNILTEKLSSYVQLTKDDKKWLLEIRACLLTFEKISSHDIGLLHNAQVFNKNEKLEDSDVLVYQKPKHKKKIKAGHFNLNSVDIEFVNNLYDVATDLLLKCQNALNAKHGIRIGIRPEDIHLSNEYTDSNRTEPFTIKSDVVELLGSELLIHNDWSDTRMISKISTGTLIKPHTDVELVFNSDKILIFDENCGDRI